jgi:hypothetical protein
LIVGVVDTLGRFLLPTLLSGIMEASAARGVGSALASMLIYHSDGRRAGRSSQRGLLPGNDVTCITEKIVSTLCLC